MFNDSSWIGSRYLDQIYNIIVQYHETINNVIFWFGPFQSCDCVYGVSITLDTYDPRPSPSPINTRKAGERESRTRGVTFTWKMDSRYIINDIEWRWLLSVASLMRTRFSVCLSFPRISRLGYLFIHLYHAWPRNCARWQQHSRVDTFSSSWLA